MAEGVQCGSAREPNQPEGSAEIRDLAISAWRRLRAHGLRVSSTGR